MSRGITALEKMVESLRRRNYCTPEEAEFINIIVKTAKEKGVEVPDIEIEPFGPDLSFPLPAKEGLFYRDYQKVIAYLLERQRGLVLADPVGTGKTVGAIGSLNHLRPRKVLIVVPAFLRLNWERELDRWLVYSPRIKLLSYEKFIREPDESYDFVIFDEAHYLKGISKRTAKMLSTRADRFLFMTATPMWKNAGDMCFILNKAKNPDYVPKRAYDVQSLYWNFAKKYCYIVNTPYGQKPDRVKSPISLRADFAEVFVRRRVEDILRELPERVITPLWMEPNEEIESLIQEELREYLKGKESEHLSHVRQRIALTKAPYLVALGKEILQSEDRLIFVAWHRDVAKALADIFNREGYKTFLITGETSHVDRDRYVQEFQSEKEERMVLIGTMGAMGVGLTLTRSSHMVFAELDYVPSNIEQAMGRIHRIGTKTNPIYYFPIFTGSVEERIYQTLIERDAESSFLISQSAHLDQSSRIRKGAKKR